MNFIIFLNLIFLILIKSYAEKLKIQEESFEIFLSNSTNFNYDEITNLIVFGDSHSSVSVNFNDMSYRNNTIWKKWPLHLINIHKATLWNYAISRSSIVVKNLKNRYNGEINDFQNQYNIFMNNMSIGKRFNKNWNSTSTLFAVWIGANDVKRIKEKYERLTKLQKVYFKILENLYNAGARNFLLINILPLEKAAAYYYHPDQLNIYLKKNVFNFNKYLIENSKKFFSKFSDINLFYYDINKKLTNIIDNCNKYMFKNCISAWIENKNLNMEEFLWADMTHISDKANEILAKSIDELLNYLD